MYIYISGFYVARKETRNDKSQNGRLFTDTNRL